MRRVAFLRAINVGGRTVRMDRLRELFSGMGFDAVETFIASGNVVFDAPPSAGNRDLEDVIEPALREGLGYDVDTFVRSLDDLRRVDQYEPFDASELAVPTNTLYIAFLKAPLPEDRVAAALELRTPVDDLHIARTELYWLRRRALGDSTVYGPGLEKLLGGPTTTRNANTVRRLVAKYG